MKHSILIVEDEELLLKAIAKKLELSNFSPIPCSSGKQAIEYLESVQTLPDAIWLDYYLKDMNGLEFATILKQNTRLSSIPIVVVSNSANTEKINIMLALGAKKYLLKADYKLEEIIAIFKEFIIEGKENDVKTIGS